MIARIGRRKSALLVAVCLGVCFLAVGSGILLTSCGLPGWLAEAWPWGPKPVDPGGAGGNGGTGGTGGADPGDYAIYVDQVIRVPKPDAGGGQAAPVPNPPRIVTRGEAGSGRVALTFDAGWISDPALPLLAMLAEKELKVTFFPRAKWIEDHPDLARAILAGGHEIGSHSYTHPDMTKIDATQVAAEISKAKQTLVTVCGSAAFVPLYRPPYGAHGETVSRVLAEHGYGWVVMWQVDSLDWKTDRTADDIVNTVLGKVADGGIVLMHIGRVETLQALPRILDGLAQRGLSVVKVSELLAIGNDDGQTAAYTVKAGDTLSSIARAHGTTVQRLLQLNPQIKK